jgi:hypothetical protein
LGCWPIEIDGRFEWGQQLGQDAPEGLSHILSRLEALLFNAFPQTRKKPGGGLNPSICDQKCCFELLEKRLINPSQAEEPGQLPAGSAQSGTKTLDPSGSRRL